MAKFFNLKTLAHLALSVLPYAAVSLAHLPGALGIAGSALMQIVALHSAPPAPKAGA